VILLLGVGILTASCGRKTSSDSGNVTVFNAACFSTLMDGIRDEVELRIKIHAEASGSQVVCRKVTELGRDCDLMMLADRRLFKMLASSHVSWRIDFANDELVLGVGIRASKADDAETDWVKVLQNEEVHLGRVNETLGPCGYQTLLAWKLMEASGHPGLEARLKEKSEKVVDDVLHLATLLKAGDLDYGFIYRSTCVEHDIRFILLKKEINLGAADIDYSSAQVTIETRKSGTESRVTVQGSPITYSLSIPASAVHRRQAIALIHYILARYPEQSDSFGYSFFQPRFFGAKKDYEDFKDVATYSGVF
jgi:molybdate/tungstate transport system substrate-binding protein